MFKLTLTLFGPFYQLARKFSKQILGTSKQQPLKDLAALQ
jgi:hypothetical protein